MAIAADIYGWVETYDDEWDGIIKASHLMYRDYYVFGALFGIRRLGLTPAAERRGLPEDSSREVKDDLKSWDKIAAPSWITWQELQSVAWDEHPPHDWWLLLFKLMQDLADRWGSENVRLVVWFDTE